MPALRRDAVVRVVGDIVCTGILIADDRVLTARACVAAYDDRARALAREQAPRQITIEVGGDDLPWAEVGVRAIFAPGAGATQDGGDLAVLILARRIPGVVVSSPQPDAAPGRGARLVVVGFGRCVGSPEAIRRRLRDAGEIKMITPEHFGAYTALCPGDLGAPVYADGDLLGFASAGTLVGVVSAGTLDGDGNTPAPQRFTRIDAWLRRFSTALQGSTGARP